jgi:hypothetical protein
MTKKARTKIKFSDSAAAAVAGEHGFLMEWYVNLFLLDGKKYFIFTESKTLYSVVVDSKGTNSLKEFQPVSSRIVVQAIEECIPGTKVEGTILEDLQIGKTENRGVLGSQNDLIYMAQVQSLYSRNKDFRMINETPMSFLKYESPEREFRKQFRELKEDEIV